MKPITIAACVGFALLIAGAILSWRVAVSRSSTPRFSKATISWQHELEISETLWESIEPVAVVVTNRHELDRLALFFPEHQLKAETPLPTIVSLATIQFVRPSGEVVSVRIYPNFGGWGSRRASWPLPPDFAPFFIDLCHRLQHEQHPTPEAEESDGDPRTASRSNGNLPESSSRRNPRSGDSARSWNVRSTASNKFAAAR